MPIAIDPADRKLLLIAGAVMIVLFTALTIAAPPQSSQDSTFPSLYSSSPEGGRAAYLLLQQLHRSVQPWERPPTELPADSEDAVLILANPTETPSGEEQKALMRFVQSGGRILFTGARLADFFPGVEISDEFGTQKEKSFHAAIPSRYTRGAPNITMKAQAAWEDDDPLKLILYGDSDLAAIVSWKVGTGEILWWAGATPLTNAGIAREDNLNLFLDAVSDSTADSNQQPDIYWDEYFHGERVSLWSYFQRTSVPWGLLQLSLLGLALLFTFSRRSGPIAIPPVVSRLWPLEFVDTLGGLYQRAHAEPAVIAVVYQRFRALVTRNLRLSNATTDVAIERAVKGRLGLKDDAFLELLQRADSASHSPKVAPGDALALIQQLESYEEQLGMKTKRKKDKL